MGKHEPQLCASARCGCWAICACGWRSRLYTTVTGAHIAFGAHLVDEDGKQLTDDELEALADEAERGYDVSKLPRRRKPPRKGKR